ncbi:MAG: GDSL-type esterase/lipase family protein [Acidimicrobiales bacterium]
MSLAAAPVVVIGLLGAELQLARIGPKLPDDTPLDHDGHIGPAGRSLRMVWLGDSTAAGVGASSAAAAVPARVALGLRRPIDLVDLAVSGDRVRDVVHDQLPKLAAQHPDVILISIGANDAIHLTSRAAFRRTYEQMLAAMPTDVKVVLLGVPDMGAPPRLAQPLRALAGLRGRQLDTLVRKMARDAGALYVNIAEETGPTMRSDTSRYFAADRYHPADDGYALWAAAVLDVLRPTLARPEEVVGAN